MEDSLNLSQTRQSEWMDISIDSPRCVAGERFSGEILLSLPSNSEFLTLSLKSHGRESVSIKESGGGLIRHSVDIFTLNQVLSDKFEQGKVQAIFPFTFKLPVFSPASFNFNEKDSEGNLIEVTVSYEIVAVLYSPTKEILICKKNFYVFNRNTRKVLSGSSSQDTLLNCCFCCTQGTSSISISYSDPEHLVCGARKTYKVAVSSGSNRKLESMMGQVLFDLVVKVPGARDFAVSQVISRTVPRLGSIIDASDQVEKLGLDYEVDLEQSRLGNNPCSNSGALFGAEYNIQFYANYNVGCRMKSAGCSLSLHVNPQAPVKDNVEFPHRWDPTEHLISNLNLEASNGIPYPQGTVVVNRKRE